MVIFNTQKFLFLKVDSQHLFRKHRKHIQVCRKFEQRYTVMQAKDTRLQNNHMNTKICQLNSVFTNVFLSFTYWMPVLRAQ